MKSIVWAPLHGALPSATSGYLLDLKMRSTDVSQPQIGSLARGKMLVISKFVFRFSTTLDRNAFEIDRIHFSN